MKKGLIGRSRIIDLVCHPSTHLYAQNWLTELLVIQGTAGTDFSGKLTQEELSNTVEFAMQSYNKVTPDEEAHAMKLMHEINNPVPGRVQLQLSSEDERILRTIQARKMLQCQATINLNHFTEQAVNGMAPRLARGMVGLAPATQTERGAEDSAPPRVPVRMDDESNVATKHGVKTH